MYKPHPQLAII